MAWQARPKQSTKSRAMHEIEQDTEIDQHKDMVNIKSVNFNSVRSVIALRLKTNSSQNKVKYAYRIDMGNNVNLISFNGFEILFPEATMKWLGNTIDKSFILKHIINRAYIIGICSIVMRHRHKEKLCRF